MLGRISTRIAVGNAAVVGMVLITASAGFFGMLKMDSVLQFISGPAWETADSVMESVIETESQIIGVNAVLNGEKLTSEDQDPETAGKAADEIFKEIFKNDQIDPASIAGLKKRRATYTDHLAVLLETNTEYHNAVREFQASFDRFQQVLLRIEKTIDVVSIESAGDYLEQATVGYPLVKGHHEMDLAWLKFCTFAANLDYQRVTELAPNVEGYLTVLQAKIETLNKALASAPTAPPNFEPVSFSEALDDFRSKVNALTEVSVKMAAAREAYVAACDDLLGFIGKVEDDADEVVNATVRTVGPTISSVMNLIIASAVLCVLASIVIAYFVIRSIKRPLNATITALKNISEGEADLTKRLDESVAGEFGELSKYFNRFANRIQNAMVEIETQMYQLGTSTNQLGLASSANSTRATELRDMSSSMKSSIVELSSSIGEIASSSERAADKATTTASKAAEADTKLESLDNAAGDISRVIAVIEEIAEQTNLLALNATIEAARAGESGRGFAVVANEVKALAQQSATATEDIRSRIGSIQASAREVISTIREMNSSINLVCNESRTIASAVEQQSMVSQSLLGTLSDGFQATETMAEITGETELGIQRLKDITGSLNNLVRTYKTRPAREQTPTTKLAKV